MVHAISSKPNTNNQVAMLGLSSLLITSFLFFIDEGNYNFRWMTEAVNWIIFMVYAVPIFLSQLFISQVLLRGKSGIAKFLISMLAGAAVGITFVIFVVFTNW